MTLRLSHVCASLIKCSIDLVVNDLCSNSDIQGYIKLFSVYWCIANVHLPLVTTAGLAIRPFLLCLLSPTILCDILFLHDD